MQNQDIRTEIKRNGLFLWQVADKLGIYDTNFSKKLRRELSDEEKRRVREAIDELTKARFEL